jgi:multicomponent Na+:H+ antiporter subunit D
VYIVGHGLVKGSLFLGAGILLNRFGSVDENTLQGLGRPFRTIAALFLIGGLALSGLPPFGTHVGKSMIDEAASEAGHGWLKVLSVLVAALTGGAVLRASGQIFLGIGARNDSQSQTPTHENKETAENYNRPPAVMFYPAATLLVLALIAGLWTPLERNALSAARRFEDSQAYATAVLGEAKQKPFVAVEEESSPSHSLFLGFLSAAGAILVALVSLFPDVLPRPLRAATCKIFGPLSTFVHELHSGDVADYVTWVTVGVSVIGSVLAVLMLAPK